MTSNKPLLTPVCPSCGHPYMLKTSMDGDYYYCETHKTKHFVDDPDVRASRKGCGYLFLLIFGTIFLLAVGGIATVLREIPDYNPNPPQRQK